VPPVGLLVRLDVLLERRLLAEVLAADLALEGLLSGVDPFVVAPLQIRIPL